MTAALTLLACVRPMLMLYRLTVWRGALLPVAGILYTAITVDPARRHRVGRGGPWKGQVLAGAGESGG